MMIDRKLTLRSLLLAGFALGYALLQAACVRWLLQSDLVSPP